MRIPTVVQRVALTLLVVLASTLATAAPAAADPPPLDNPFPVIGNGRAYLWYQPSTETLEVWLTGDVPASAPRVAGTWTAVITGFRQATATSVPVPVQETWTDSGHVVNERFSFPKSGQYGSLTVDFSYTAASTYVLVRSVHTLEWNPWLGMNTAGFNIGG